MNGYLALIDARVGENDLAIPLIERLLATPGAVDSTDYSITVNDLKHRWEWDPLRNDPRFQKLTDARRAVGAQSLSDPAEIGWQISKFPLPTEKQIGGLVPALIDP